MPPRTAHYLDDPAAWQTFLGLIRTGKPFGLACQVMRVTRLAMNTYLDGNPERAAEYIEAELSATEEIEQVLYEEAKARQKWAVQMWLERRDRDRWAPTAEQGPKRLVLDPASLKGMIGTGMSEGGRSADGLTGSPDPEGDTAVVVDAGDDEVAVVDDDGGASAVTPAEVPTVKVVAEHPGGEPAPF